MANTNANALLVFGLGRTKGDIQVTVIGCALLPLFAALGRLD